MPKLPPLRPKQVLKVLLKIGFYVHHQVGSHVQLRHPEKTYLRVTVPRHDQFDLPTHVVLSILNQAEVSKGEFVKLLKNK